MKILNFIGNRYRILNLDGELEFDKLYKARDAYDNKYVYIKILENSPYIQEDFISQLIDESTTVRELNSPYILDIIDIGFHYTEVDVLFYIVSEYFEGISLDKLIKGNYIHLEAIISMATQILKGLETAYDRYIYHGDLKPSNILVDKWHNVKIANFGVTKANAGINIRANKLIEYLSPHQLCINYTDQESDFFALGLIIFESIFKKLPYPEAKDEGEMLRYIDKGIEWRDFNAINGNKQLIDIVKKLLNRSNKYKNAQQIIVELSSIMYEKADIQESLYINNKINIEEDIIINKNKFKRTVLLGIAATIVLSTLTMFM